MNVLRTAVTAIAISVAAISASFAHDEDELGVVRFPTSCSPQVQADFERGVAMLHSYWFSYAGKQFKSIVEKDPNCAMAYWGIALDLMGNTLGGGPAVKEVQAGLEAIEKGVALNAKTQRERDWIAAAAQYFRGYNDVPLETRLLSYTTAMEQITRRYPDDYEAWVFYALTLQASAPKADLTYANQIKSAAILDKMYEQNPKHPGVSHFLIHAFDYPPLAERGIPAARRYAGIAPAVPHARHMPSHIYSMVGLWEESIASNARALEIQPDYRHASDFTVYAHLQLAQDAQAKAVMEKSQSVPDRGDRPVGGGNFTAAAAMPARYMLERADWKGAAALPVTTTAYPMADAITRFTRGLGMARSGDVAGARAEIEAIGGHRRALEKSRQQYWADRSEEQMLAITAWIHYANGARDDALKFMRAAADGEDGSVKHILMENRLYPMRELLADMLLEMKQPALALKEYETALRDNPNRYRGFYGAARAADAANERTKAADYFAKLIALSNKADTERPEFVRAKAYLAQK
jgi:tetratricopeptide (TPR) repeat protein